MGDDVVRLREHYRGDDVVRLCEHWARRFLQLARKDRRVDKRRKVERQVEQRIVGQPASEVRATLQKFLVVISCADVVNR